MIGFLAPNGEFIRCNQWEHTSKASEICKSQYDMDLGGITAEDYILEKGYLVIRARDAYMSFWNSNKEFISLSAQQLKWLADNANEFTDMQKQDINEILLDQESYKEMVERYWQKQQ